MKTPDLKERLAGALADGKLAGSLGRFGEAYAVSRARAYEGISFEALRDRLVAVKGRAAGRERRAVDQRTASDYPHRNATPRLPPRRWWE